MEKAAIRQAVISRMTASGFNQSEMANLLEVSDSEISQLVKPNGHTREYPSDKTWRKMEANLVATGQIATAAPSSNGETDHWKTIDTKVRAAVYDVCKEAKKYGEAKGITAPTGAGKTTSLKAFASENAGTYYIFCTALLTPLPFLRKIARTFGLKTAGITRTDLCDNIAQKINTDKKPLIILDDMSKLPVATFSILQTIYDLTEGNCGWVYAGLNTLKTDIAKKAERDFKNFRELKRRTDDWTELNTWNATGKYDKNDPPRKVIEMKAILDEYPLGDHAEYNAIFTTLYNSIDNLGSLKKVLTKAMRLCAENVLILDAINIALSTKSTI